MGTLAGRSRGTEFKPFRLTPSHHWAKEQGAVFVEVGMWLRTQWVPKAGETEWRQSVDREVLATRKSVGICDVTTLGKIDIQGTDAGAFLDRVYANTFSTLAVGKCRYGLMLREDGIVFDDGTTARMGENEYVMTTTTANAVTVFRHLEYCRQVLWPDMDVQLISTTEAWAQFSVAGPNARKLLEKVVDQDISDAAFPYMGAGNITVCGGMRARLFRISFSGELAYEIAVPTRYGDALLREMLARGAEFDPIVYGTEALGVMRIEKGHVAGGELNGQSTALNMGLGKIGVEEEGLHRDGPVPARGVGRAGRLSAGRRQAGRSERQDFRRQPFAGERCGGGGGERWRMADLQGLQPAYRLRYRACVSEGGRPQDRAADAGGEPADRAGHRGRDREPAFL